MNKTDLIEQAYLRSDIPEFRPGDTVKVHVRVVEGTRERVQVFQGVVIGRQNGGLRETFTVRKISFGVGVERTFPLHSPSIAKLEIVTRGRVRRAKLYYLRDLRGKKARIKERRIDDAKLAAPRGCCHRSRRGHRGRRRGGNNRCRGRSRPRSIDDARRRCGDSGRGGGPGDPGAQTRPPTRLRTTPQA